MNTLFDFPDALRAKGDLLRLRKYGDTAAHPQSQIQEDTASQNSR